MPRPTVHGVGSLTRISLLGPTLADLDLDLKAFEELMATWDEVRECHMLAGEADFLLKIVAETWDEYQKFLTTRLTSAPNVSHVKSMMVFRTAKQMPGVEDLQFRRQSDHALSVRQDQTQALRNAERAKRCNERRNVEIRDDPPVEQTEGEADGQRRKEGDR